MLLYERNNDILEVYDFSAKKEVLEEYRKKQMQKIPEDERILTAETCISNWSDTPLFESFSTNYSDKILTSNYADNKSVSENRYHTLKKSNKDTNHNQQLLNFYYTGNLKDKNMVRIKYLEGIRYLLLKNKSYHFIGENNGRKYQMNDIIQLPKSLYILQLIEQTNFEALKKYDIKDELSLFILSKIEEISLTELQKTDKLNITTGIYDSVTKKADTDHKILKLLKK